MPIRDMTEIVIKEEDSRLVKGFASVEILDRQNDMVPVDAMQGAMLKYMERGGLIMYGHLNKPVGKVLSWEVKEEPSYGVPAVEIIAQINKGYKMEDEVWELIKSHKLSGFSIGGTATEVGEAKMADGSNARVLKSLELSEISIVVEPANQGALINAVSIAKASTEKEIDDNEVEKVAEEAVKEILFEREILKENISKKSYPWSKCISDQKKHGYSAGSAKKICGSIKAKYGKGIGMLDYDEDFIMHTFIIQKEEGKDQKEYKARPSKMFMEYCIPKALEKERGDEGGARRLCGFIFYYEFRADLLEAEDWAMNGKINDDMLLHHNIHSYFAYQTKSSIISRHLENGVFPTLQWFDKCVANYEGEESPERACVYLWSSNYYNLGKENEPSVPVIDDEIKNLRLYFPNVIKSIDTMIEVMKPFHGFKNWEDCMKKIGKGSKKYSKEVKQKICGRLKADYEKENNVEKSSRLKREEVPDFVSCPYCGESDFEVGESYPVIPSGEGPDPSIEGMFYEAKCKNCGKTSRFTVWDTGNDEDIEVQFEDEETEKDSHYDPEIVDESEEDKEKREKERIERFLRASKVDQTDNKKK